MSSFKGDNRFTKRYDEATYDSPHSDTSDEAEMPRYMHRLRSQWLEENYDALDCCYSNFMEVGRVVFGGAFFQQGDLAEFGKFVFRFTQVGATKSNSSMACLDGSSDSAWLRGT